MILQSKRVWIAGQFVPAQIEMKDQKIVNILPWSTVKCDEDWGNNRILPGFIDIHTHGAYGFDTNDAEKDGLRNWMKRIPEEGVTAILPMMLLRKDWLTGLPTSRRKELLLSFRLPLHRCRMS